MKTETSKSFYTYDGHGRTTRIDASQGTSVVYAYDARNRVTKHRKPDGDTTTFVYNHLRLTQVIDGKGQTYGFAYNAMGWDTAHVDPAGQVKTYRYDANGNLVQWTNRRGQVITFTYDAIDRLLTRAGAADSTTFIHAFNDSTLVAFNSASRDSLKFDLGGRLTSSSTKRGSTSYRLEYTNDVADRKTQLTLAAPGTPATIAKWAYNAFGQVDTMVDAGNRTTTFGYNSDRLRDTTRYPTDGTPTVRITAPLSSHAAGGIFYSKPSVDVIAGREIKLDSLTHLVGSWFSQQDTFRLADYNLNGRLNIFRINRTTAPGSCSSDVKFGANCPSGDTILVRQFTYQYDPVGNSFSAVDSMALGNRAIRVATDFLDGGGNPVIDTMTYDLDGNLTERKAGTGMQKYFWNALSQLDSVQTFGAGILHNTGKHRYDAFGRRIHHFVLGDSIRFIWDGDQSVVEVDSSMTVSVKYTYEPGSLSPYSMTRGGATYYYLYDEANNVTALLKQDSTVPNRYRYWPFGFPYQRIEGVQNNHTFQGQPSEAESGMIYMRNRFYSFRMRRFISEDPIGLAGGINLYTYANNDPVNGSDPLGLQPEQDCLEWGVRGSGSMEHGFEATVYCVKYKPPPQRRGPASEVLNLWGVSSSGFVAPRGPKSVIVPPEACSTERTQAITAFSMSLAGMSATGAVLSYAKSPAAMSLHQASAVGGRFSTYVGVGVPTSLLLRSGGVEVRYSSTAANTAYGLAKATPYLSGLVELSEEARACWR